MINLHIDVDNFWMYEKEYGIKINSDKEFIYKKCLPNLLRLLKKHNSKATFMIIGKDLQLPACVNFCNVANSSGHEIANHSWSHSINFSSLSYNQKMVEITKSHEIIKKTIHKNPVGFRGPGYYTDKDIIKILGELNYSYDSSILPGYAQILMTSYSKIKGGKNSKKTFGNKRDILSKTNKYKINDTNLWELPISTLPFIKLPIQTTFAYYFGNWYRNRIFEYIKKKPNYITYLFHAIDFAEINPERNHPVIALRLSFDERMNFADRIIENLVKANKNGLTTSEEFISANHH